MKTYVSIIPRIARVVNPSSANDAEKARRLAQLGRILLKIAAKGGAQ